MAAVLCNCWRRYLGTQGRDIRREREFEEHLGRSSLLLAHGLSNKEIAVRLKLHPRTVALHIAALKEVFGASSRAQSVQKAVEMGLIEE